MELILKPLSKCYSSAEEYIINLVQLDVKHFLVVRKENAEENADDVKVIQEFSAFLRDYISRHKKTINFSNSATFDKITVSLNTG